MVSYESIFTMCFIVLLLVNVGVPYLTSTFTGDSQYDTSGLESKNNGLSILQTVSGVLFWSFGLYPFWLDMIMLVFRILFYVSIYRVVNPLA